MSTIVYVVLGRHRGGGGQQRQTFLKSRLGQPRVHVSGFFLGRCGCQAQSIDHFSRQLPVSDLWLAGGGRFPAGHGTLLTVLVLFFVVWVAKEPAVEEDRRLLFPPCFFPAVDRCCRLRSSWDFQNDGEFVSRLGCFDVLLSNYFS